MAKRSPTGRQKRELSLLKSERLIHQCGGELRKAVSGIYHVLYEFGDTTYSAYYFCDTGQWRWFWPYPSQWDGQQKLTFRSQNNLIKYIRGLRKRSKGMAAMAEAIPGELGQTMLCPHCEGESKIPPIVTGSCCYGCRFRDSQILILRTKIKQLERQVKEA